MGGGRLVLTRRLVAEWWRSSPSLPFMSIRIASNNSNKKRRRRRRRRRRRSSTECWFVLLSLSCYGPAVFGYPRPSVRISIIFLLCNRGQKHRRRRKESLNKKGNQFRSDASFRVYCMFYISFSPLIKRKRSKNKSSKNKSSSCSQGYRTYTTSTRVIT